MKTETILIRATEAEVKQVRIMAEAAKMSVSKFIRTLIQSAIGKCPTCGAKGGKCA